MAQRLFRNIFLLIFVNLLVKPLWIFGIDLHVQNTVGAENYGFYFVIFNFSFLFHILLDLGVHQFNNREVARNPSLLATQFGKLFALKAFLAVMYFTVTFCLAQLFGYTFLQKKMLFFLAINQLLLSFILFSRSNFTAMQWYKWDSFFSVFDRVLSIILCALLLYTPFFGPFEIIDFVYAQTIALILGAILSLAIVAWKGEVVYPKFEWKSLFPLLIQSFPFALVVLLMTIYTRIDAVMLGKLLGDTGNIQAGIYAGAYRILDAMNMLPFLLASLLIPFFARKLKSKESFSEEMWTSVSLIWVISVPVVILTYYFHPQVIDLLYKQGDSEWFLSFQMLLFSFPLVALSYVFGGFLTAAGRLKTISIFALITIVLNLVLNFILIPQYGAGGAAIATFFSQGLMAFAQLIVVMKNWETNFDLAMLKKGFLYTLALGFIAYAFSFLALAWFLKIALFILIAVILSLILRLISIQKLKFL